MWPTESRYQHDTAFGNRLVNVFNVDHLRATVHVQAGVLWIVIVKFYPPPLNRHNYHTLRVTFSRFVNVGVSSRNSI